MTLASGKATAKQTVNVVAKNDTGLESQPTTAMTPLMLPHQQLVTLLEIQQLVMKSLGRRTLIPPLKYGTQMEQLLVQRQRMIKETLLWTFRRSR